MLVKISRHARVFVTKEQIQFIEKYLKRFPILQHRLDVEDVPVAKILAYKCILVRKKIVDSTQYALNTLVDINGLLKEKGSATADKGL